MAMTAGDSPSAVPHGEGGNQGPVFVTGGTGYLGVPFIATLLRRGHRVHALVRRGSETRLPPGVVPVVGDALEASTFAAAMPAGASVVHLVGTPRPNPTKAADFRRVDLASIRATVAAAAPAGARHLIYVSVAHPAPIMHAYIAVRREGEALVEAAGIPATILRPWYILGPGHRWPYLLLPLQFDRSYEHSPVNAKNDKELQDQPE